MRAFRALVIVLCTLSAAACRDHPKAAAVQETTWRKLGSWAGSGNVQTESFTSDSGALRFRWKTSAHAGAPTPGTFLITLHSSISGRPLQVAVEQRGPGENTAYLSDDPRVFFARVESAGLDWSFTVEEGYSGPVVP